MKLEILKAYPPAKKKKYKTESGVGGAVYEIAAS